MNMNLSVGKGAIQHRSMVGMPKLAAGNPNRFMVARTSGFVQRPALRRCEIFQEVHGLCFGQLEAFYYPFLPYLMYLV